MRKTSRTTDSQHDVDVHNAEETRPRRIAGASITSWAGSAAVEQAGLLAEPAKGGTITGSASNHAADPKLSPRRRNTIALSDGTQITFASVGHFTLVDAD